MDFYYSTEKNSQMIVALLKAHGIKNIVVSPGTTNISLVVSLQHDSYFIMYSCVDERSAAFMACGIASETNSPVVLICTESTASRNYYPGLTEAYHRKLPILAITCLHSYSSIGHLESQVIDRSVSPIDSIRLKVNLPILKDETDIWESEIKINQAILELTRHGGGPVHVNLPWPYKPYNFSTHDLPDVRVIKRFFSYQHLPDIPSGKIAVFIGTHKKWNSDETRAFELFCEKYGAVAFCGHTSNYQGKYYINSNLLANQLCDFTIFNNIELVIHIGEEATDLLTLTKLKKAKQTWRVSEDGELRDTFRNLINVFEMTEYDFFSYYAAKENKNRHLNYLQKCIECQKQVNAQLPELPFSNIYAASKIMGELPENSVVYLGASSTIRAWSMFDFPSTVEANGNMGTRGIDGTLSTAIGASLTNPQRIYYCILGDLNFFYDMGSLGNRHIGNNFRILLINNGGGSLFKQGNAPGRRIGNENANLYIAAAGHWGNKSTSLLKHYSEDLNFVYLSASNKKDFEAVLHKFLDPHISEHPILFEIFTNDEDERTAFDLMGHIIMDTKGQIKKKAKDILGDKGVNFIKNMVKK